MAAQTARTPGRANPGRIVSTFRSPHVPEGLPLGGAPLGRRVGGVLLHHHGARGRTRRHVSVCALKKKEEPERRPVGCTTNLRIYIDSASPRQWEKYLATGLVYGATTNPIILERDGVRCNIDTLTYLVQRGISQGLQEVVLQAWGGSTQAMYHTSLDLAGIDPKRVVVALPATAEGLECAAMLRGSAVRVAITCVFSPYQVLMAEAVGAEFAAPFLGRITDMGKDGLSEVAEMAEALEVTGSDMRLLVSSIRSPHDLPRMAAEGCDTFAVSPAVLDAMLNEPATIDAAKAFEETAQSLADGGDDS